MTNIYISYKRGRFFHQVENTLSSCYDDTEIQSCVTRTRNVPRPFSEVKRVGRFGRKFFRKKLLRYLFHRPHVPITSDIKNSLLSNPPTFQTCRVHGREGREGKEKRGKFRSRGYENELNEHGDREKYRIYIFNPIIRSKR